MLGFCGCWETAWQILTSCEVTERVSLWKRVLPDLAVWCGIKVLDFQAGGKHLHSQVDFRRFAAVSQYDLANVRTRRDRLTGLIFLHPDRTTISLARINPCLWQSVVSSNLIITQAINESRHYRERPFRILAKCNGLFHSAGWNCVTVSWSCGWVATNKKCIFTGLS